MIHDSSMNETKLWILSVVDASTRKCPAVYLATRIHPNTVRSVRQPMVYNRAAARYLRCVNGKEFIARSTTMRLREANCTARFVQPAKRSQNRSIESVHSTMGRGQLGIEVAFNLLDAPLRTTVYRNDTHQVRPYSATKHLKNMQQ